MPVDFPTTSPNVIAPINLAFSWNTSADQATPAFAKAKIGSTT